MTYQKEDVIDALAKVIHPAKKADIISLNMIDKIMISNNQISFQLIFAEHNDPFVNSIRKACVSALQSHLGEGVEVENGITVVLPKVEKPEPLIPGVKKVIAVASGKGGVGKSTVSVNLAIALAKQGLKVGLIDADIYGPSIPIMFGLVDQKPEAVEKDGKVKVVPFEKYGIKVLSIGFFVDSTQALIWRGPMASNALKQLFSEAHWGDLDCMVIDLPPGTGDIHLTLVQSVKVDGIVVVSTPQQVAIADARKAVAMFNQKNIKVPILGFVENMAWFTPAELPDKKYHIFGKDGTSALAAELNITMLGQIPITESVCQSGDKGIPAVEDISNPARQAFIDCALNVKKHLFKTENAEKINIPPHLRN